MLVRFIVHSILSVRSQEKNMPPPLRGVELLAIKEFFMISAYRLLLFIAPPFAVVAVQLMNFVLLMK